MKKDTHPEYEPVVFHDVSSDFKILTKSTLKSKETIEWEDGNTYPLVRVEISSASHPFYTGKRQQIAERGGRIEQFRRRYGQEGADDGPVDDGPSSATQAASAAATADGSPIEAPEGGEGNTENAAVEAGQGDGAGETSDTEVTENTSEG